MVPAVSRPVCLITGPSSGIGLELATLFARDGHDLVLVARSREKLEDIGRALHEEFGVTATVVARDLADPASPGIITKELATRGIAVDALVNNAGFGVYGLFAETPLEKELEMIQVNIAALTHLTKLFLPGMIARGRGRILNVASTAAFQPGPLMAVYYATKAYVLSFSEALSNETDGTGVTVTALCPGPTITEFQKQAGLEKTNLFNSPLVMSAADAARAGYDGMKKGRRVVVAGFGNALLVQGTRLAPRRLSTAIARRIQESRK
jgi:short-subunit dehydrogenase